MQGSDLFSLTTAETVTGGEAKKNAAMTQPIDFDMLQLLMMKILIDNDLRYHRKKYGRHLNRENSCVRTEMETLQVKFEIAIMSLEKKQMNNEG